MALRHKYKYASDILERLSAEDRRNLIDICKRIQKAEERLLTEGEPVFKKCRTQCRGMCCRNIDINAILGCTDFLYILTMESQLQPMIEQCLENEVLFFSANCIFLENGEGPCIFPSHSMPEVCILSFCSDDTLIIDRIKEIQGLFQRLDWFVKKRAMADLKNWLLSFIRQLFLK